MSTFSRRQFTAGLAAAAIGAKSTAFGLGETTQQASYTLEVCFHGLWVFLVNESTGWITAKAFMDPFAEHCFVGGRFEDYSAPKFGIKTLQLLPSSMTLKGLPTSGSGDFDPTANFVYGDSSSWNGLQGSHVEVVLPCKPTYPVMSRRSAWVQVIPQSGSPYTQAVSLSQHLSYVINPGTTPAFYDPNGNPSAFNWNWSPSPTNSRDDVHFFAGPASHVDPMHAIAALYGVLNTRMGATSLVFPLLSGAPPMVDCDSATSTVLNPDDDLSEIPCFECPSDSGLKAEKTAKSRDEAQKRGSVKSGKSQWAAQSKEKMTSSPEIANCMSIVCPG